MSPATGFRIAMVGTAGPVATGNGGGPRDEIAAAAERGADLVMLPQLSFSPYFPAVRDREALELGERLPSKTMAAALAVTGDALLAATVYECVGEGVFYVRGQVASASGQCVLADRQHRVAGSPGRYEQMYFSPGHGPRSVSELPWGRTGLLIGGDLNSIEAWSELAGLGADLVIGSTSLDQDGWVRTCRVASGLATVNGIALALVNRAPSETEPGFAGGELVIDRAGREIAPARDGLFDLEISDPLEAEL